MKQTALISIVDGRVDNRPTLVNIIRALPTGRYLFTIEPKSRRTIPQNSYLHMIFPLIQQGLRDNGYREVKTAEQAKEICKSLFLSYEIENGTGGKIRMIRRTRDLTKEQMSEFIDEIIQWAAEYLSIALALPLKGL